MPSYATPGVYIEEIPVFPPSVAAVATAIPVFIGFTEKAEGDLGEALTGKPTRITSLLEYKRYFGNAPVQALNIDVDKRLNAAGALLGVVVKWNGTAPSEPAHYLYYSLQLYFANGGGPCYIHSLGGYATNATKALFTDAIAALEAADEPTLILFPDAVKLSDGDHGAVVDAALTSCNKMQDRFTVADVRAAVKGGTDTNAKVTTNFRAKVTKTGVEFLKYGAAYFPYLTTLVPFRTAERDVTIKTFDTSTLQPDGTFQQAANPPTNKKLNDAGLDLANKETAVYAAIRSFLDQATVTLPPSGAVAGIYAQTDRTRGVWKAPANAGVALASGTAVAVTNDLQDGLNIDPLTGKSANAVRAFFGKGTLVWGGRTLAGNDSEWKYVNVRRFANFVEESVGKAIAAFVFEPNDANTWVKVQGMIENFLNLQWRDGALMGAKPEHAYQVAVGLGKTMSPQDVLDGYMIVEVHMAIVRPAEFVVLRFMQKMPQA
jgi:hypothetical protein